MRALDLFAGTGWGVACQRLGISEDGVENMPEAVASREAAGMHTRWLDVRDVPDTAASEYDLLIASPPCQSFSVAGKGAGRRALDDVLVGVKALAVGEQPDRTTGDERTWLVLEPFRLALHGMPTYLAWEQVPTVLPVWEACAEVLRARGYSVWTGNLQAEMYGVPQTRKRALLIARRDGVEARPPRPTHSRYYSRDPERLDSGVLPWVSMAVALGWEDGQLALRSNYGTGGDARLRGEPLSTEPSPTVTSKVDRNKWVYRASNQDHAARRPLDSPAPTVVPGARSNKIEWMPEDTAGDRAASGLRVSVREAQILQSYPPGFEFCGKQGKQYLQVGNAVPPLLAEAVLSVFGGGER